MFSTESRKKLRFQVTGEEISESKYNLIIGGVLCYGFLANIFTIAIFGEAILKAELWVVAIGYCVSGFVGTMIVNKSSNPAISFLGYNLVVLPLGVMLTYIVSAFDGQSDIVLTAMIATACVTLLMMTLGTFWPEIFMSMGKTLTIALIGSILIEVILGLIFRMNVYGISDYVVVAIFCGYVGYDWARANSYPKTVDNAIDSACDLYLDIINLFIRILRILARNRN